MRWLWFNSDSAASNLKVHELAREAKVARAAELCADSNSGWTHPTWAPEDVRERLVVHKAQPEMAIPVEFLFSPDLMHIAKNGEKHGIGMLGRSVRLGAPDRLLKCAESSALFSFARLFAKSMEIRNIMRVLAFDVGKSMGTVPGEVNHRLKIVGGLATTLHNNVGSIREACHMYFLAYAQQQPAGNAITSPVDKWRLNDAGRSRKALVEHVEEINADLHDPRMLGFNYFYSRVQLWQEAWYAVFQVDEGFNWYTVRGKLMGFMQELQEMRDNFNELFETEYMYEVWREAEKNGVLQILKNAHRGAMKEYEQKKTKKRKHTEASSPTQSPEVSVEEVAVAATAPQDDSFGEADGGLQMILLEDGDAIALQEEAHEASAGGGAAAGTGAAETATAVDTTAATAAAKHRHPFTSVNEYEGGKVNLLLMLVDDEACADQLARAQMDDFRAVLDTKLAYIWEKCEATVVGENAYPCRFASMYDVSEDPWMVARELHRWDFWHHDECRFCEGGTDPSPMEKRPTYLASPASRFGFFENPTILKELIEAAKKVYAGQCAIILPEGSAHELGPLQRCNGMSIGPATDMSVSTVMCGKYSTMEVERSFNHNALGGLMNDCVSHENVMLHMSSAAIELDDDARRRWNASFYALTRSKAAVENRIATRRKKLDREGFYQQLQDKVAVAAAKSARDARVAMEKAQRKLELAAAKELRQATTKLNQLERELQKQLKAEATLQKVQRREVVKSLPRKALEAVLKSSDMDATGSTSKLRTRIVDSSQLWKAARRDGTQQLVQTLGEELLQAGVGGTSSRRADFAGLDVPDAPGARLEQSIGLGDVNRVAGFMGISSAADTGAGGERRSARSHRVFDYAALDRGPST